MTSRQLAARLDRVGFSEIVHIRNKIHDLQIKKNDVLQFHGGEPYLETPGAIKEACLRALAENKTRYAPSNGVPELLEAILQKVRTRNDIPVEPGDVIVVNGGLHGLFVSFLSVVNPGDEVVVFSPFWTPVKDLVALSGGCAVNLNSSEARGRELSSYLERLVTKKTRAIYLNTPANPTGYAYSNSELAAVAEVALRHDLLVIADEAYEDIVYEGKHRSIASLPGMYERTITVFTFSKTFSMTGWRIGYVIAPEPWMSGIRRLTLNSINGVNTPTQWAALAALKLGAPYLQEIRQAYRLRRDLLVEGLRSVGFNCELPAGTFYAFPRVTEVLGGDSRKASVALLETAGISTVPGVVFGPEGEGHLRFSFSTPTQNIEAAVERLGTLYRGGLG